MSLFKIASVAAIALTLGAYFADAGTWSAMGYPGPRAL